MVFKHIHDSPSLKYFIGFCFLASIIVHVLIVTGLYSPGLIVSVALSALMVLAWLISGSMVKLLPEYYPDQNPWILVYEKSKAWLKWPVIFLFVYAILNFILSIRIDEGQEYFHSTVPYHKIRGISGFWMAFIGMTFLIHQTVNNLINGPEKQ